MNHSPKPVIFGCEGTRLTPEETRFFHQEQPLGFILFARNCETPQQVKELVEDCGQAVGHDRLYFLIDQEGGRVARLRPPHWRETLPAGVYAELAGKDIEAAKQAVTLNARLIAAELTALGINTDCAPMLDLQMDGAHDIVGDRAFGESPEQVVALGQAMADGLMDGGVIPIMKHIPGHGRALVDSHESLPTVDAVLETLTATDFKPFRALSNLACAMTAHIVFTALDASECVTFSSKSITYIREKIGFTGLLFSDDLSMKALSGDYAERTQRALQAGCDIILHCNGKMEEMQPIADSCSRVDNKATLQRLQAPLAITHRQAAFDPAKAEQELAALLANHRHVA